MNSPAEYCDAFTSASQALTRRAPSSREAESLRAANPKPRPTVGIGNASIVAVFLASKSPDPVVAPCRAAFKEMAKTEPAQLAAWIRRGTLSRAHISHAAEILGRATAASSSTDGVVQVLQALLSHESPVVREGGVYGLSYHLTRRVGARLLKLAASDPSPGVRAAIQHVLDA